MSQGKPQFDITEVTRKFLNQELAGRGEMHREFTAAFRDNPVLKQLAGEIGMEIVAQHAPQALQIAMMFGMELGVYLERERVQRTQKSILLIE